VSVARIWSDMTALALLDRGAGGFALDEAVRVDDMRARLVWIKFACVVSCGIAWLAWQHAAVANLRALGSRRTRFTPGWSVGWWFVPLMNIFRVPQVLGDTWRRSKIGNVIHDDAGALPDLVLAWWLTVLLASVVWRLSVTTLSDTAEGSTLQALAKSTR